MAYRPAGSQTTNRSKLLLVGAIVGGGALIALVGVICLFAFVWALKSNADATRVASYTSLSGELWQSPDGIFTVARPASPRFHEKSPRAPLVGSWISQDENIHLTVLRNPSPADTVLSQSALEAELASDVKGMILESRSEVRGGHTLYHMMARGGPPDDVMYCSQIVFESPEFYYKVIVVGFGEDPRLDPDATAFLDSLTFNAPR